MSQEQEGQSPGPRQQPRHGSPPPGQVWVLAGPRWTDVRAGRSEAAGPAGTPSPPAATRGSPPPGHNYANSRLRPPRASETPSRKRGPHPARRARPLRASPRPLPARAPSSGRWGAAGHGRPSPAPEGPGGPGPRRSPEGGAAGRGRSPAADTHRPRVRSAARQRRVRASLSVYLCAAAAAAAAAKQAARRAHAAEAGPAEDTPLRRASGCNPRTLVGCGSRKCLRLNDPFIRGGVYEDFSGLHAFLALCHICFRLI